MMGRALLIVGALATVGLLATGILGYGIPEAFETRDLPNHIMLAVFSSILLLFSHCWILFYLIGTGKALKEAVAEHGLEQEIVEKTKHFKTRSNPWLMLAMMLAMATFVLGGGVATLAVPGWVHHLLFGLTAIAQVWALWVEFEVLTANEKLMNSVDRRLRRLAEAGT
jgi:4-hydroxybenzoate polyprenyltransferase